MRSDPDRHRNRQKEPTAFCRLFHRLKQQNSIVSPYSILTPQLTPEGNQQTPGANCFDFSTHIGGLTSI